jgi:hypothetical protein
VSEQIVPAVIGRDETIALRVVEPFHSTRCHARVPYQRSRDPRG